MVVKTPPMGWNSWNTFGDRIDEQMIMEMADAMVSTGLKEAGYEYLVIDDCWSEKKRDRNGRLVADHVKFPHGMKYVADYVHGKGLKFGMYSCAGNLTCAGYPGSYEHEFTDAETFASWDVDFLKYDYCYHSPIVPGKYLYRRMGLALENTGRDILFSACSWGSDETAEWIKSTGASMWRSTPDIFDNWNSIRNLTERQSSLHPYNAPGCFNDMDMLVVGMHGNGNVGIGGCDDVQYRTHFSIWAMMGSPLMIGSDIRKMDEETRRTLMNREVLAIDQDPALRQPYRLEMQEAPGTEDLLVYARHLDGGDIAVGFFNMGGEKRQTGLNMDQLGLPVSTGRTAAFHELWTGGTVRPENGTLRLELEPYGCTLYRAKLEALPY